MFSTKTDRFDFCVAGFISVVESVREPLKMEKRGEKANENDIIKGSDEWNRATTCVCFIFILYVCMYVR